MVKRPWYMSPHLPLAFAWLNMFACIANFADGNGLIGFLCGLSSVLCLNAGLRMKTLFVFADSFGALAEADGQVTQ